MIDRQPNPDGDSNRLLRLINGYRSTCLIAAAIKIGLFEALRDGSVSASQLVPRLDTDLNSFLRFVQALRVLDLVQLQGEMIGLTDMGRLMLKDDFAFRDRAILASEEYQPVWARLDHSVRTGQPAFDEVFGVNAWRHRQDHPALGESFQRIMVDDQRQASCAVVDSFDFGGYRTVTDVGGGFGELLTEILTKHRSIRGTLFDQPWVVKAAHGRLAAAQVIDRCELLGGSFFDEIPAGSDIYILQFILHDWDNEKCLQILGHCRAAMNPSSRLLVVENILPDNAESNEHVTMLDLHMMAVLGGRERTQAEYAALFTAAGFTIENSQMTARQSLILTLKTNSTYDSARESA